MTFEKFDYPEQYGLREHCHDLPLVVVPLPTRVLGPWTKGESERSPEEMDLSSQVLEAGSPVNCAVWFYCTYASSAPLTLLLHAAYRKSPGSGVHPGSLRWYLNSLAGFRDHLTPEKKFCFSRLVGDLLGDVTFLPDESFPFKKKWEVRLNWHRNPFIQHGSVLESKYGIPSQIL